MRDSGVEFLGEVPSHWSVQPVVTLARVLTSTVDKNSYEGERAVKLCNYTDVYYSNAILDSSDFMVATANAEQIAKFSVRAGDVPFTKDSETADDIGISSYVPKDLADTVYGYHLSIYRPIDKSRGRFLKYLLDSDYAKAYFEARTPGVTRVGLGQPTIRYFRAPTPPLEEAVAIADYLDRETAQIDAFIAKNEELITLLTERRAAVIDEGLIRAAAGASVVPLKRAVQFVTVGIVVTPAKWYAESGVPALRGINVRPGSISMDNLVFLSNEGHEENRKSELRAGDVVIVRTGKAGAAAVVPAVLDRANAIDLLIVRTGTKVAPNFLAYFLNSNSTSRLIANGSVGSIQGHFNVGTLREVPVPLLPTDEQEALVHMLDEQAEQIDQAIATARRGVDLARERRSALVSAAVTGKIKVEVAA